MKILSAAQIRNWVAFTIQNEPIAALDLMERASLAFADWFCRTFPNTEDHKIQIFCGTGNNGGDGLAIARILHHRFYEVTVYRCRIGSQDSEDFTANLKRLPPYQGVTVNTLEKDDPFPLLDPGNLLIDALFGSGLNRPVTGYWGQLIEHLNASGATLISIDIPSGLFADLHSEGAIVQADYTFSFQLPKLAFFFPENSRSTGQWTFGSIGLLPEFLEQTKTDFHYIDQSLVRSFLKKRSKYDHKGIYGHALLIAGSHGKVGAAILAAKAVLRSGAGLLTVHAPRCAYPILQMSIPEAMVSVDEHDMIFSGVKNTAGYTSVGIGCGLGTNEISFLGLTHLLANNSQPLILDADALNIIAQHPALFSAIPPESIFTPHPKEFERLFGKTENDFERNSLQRQMAQELQCFIVLKGAHTAIACPDGSCYFNSTGNPGMATAGSGDVLTGILTGLLAQGYSSKETSILGVYLHGLAGDLAVNEISSQEALIAGDIIEQLGAAFKSLHNQNS